MKNGVNENNDKDLLFDLTEFNEDGIFRVSHNLILPDGQNKYSLEIRLPKSFNISRIEELKNIIISNTEAYYRVTPSLKININGEEIKKSTEVSDITSGKVLNILEQTYMFSGSYWSPIEASSYVPIEGLNFKIDMNNKLTNNELLDISEMNPEDYNIRFEVDGKIIKIDEIGPNISFFKNTNKNKICINFGSLKIDKKIKEKIIDNIQEIVNRQKQENVNIEVVGVIV